MSLAAASAAATSGTWVQNPMASAEETNDLLLKSCTHVKKIYICNMYINYVCVCYVSDCQTRVSYHFCWKKDVVECQVLRCFK